MKRWAVLLLMLVAAQTAQAFDFVSVAEPAILYDANSIKAKKLFVATRNLPLEVIVELADWVKVRDNTGKLFWIEKRQLSSKRYVIVIVPATIVRRNPEEKRRGGIQSYATTRIGMDGQYGIRLGQSAPMRTAVRIPQIRRRVG